MNIFLKYGLCILALAHNAAYAFNGVSEIDSLIKAVEKGSIPAVQTWLSRAGHIPVIQIINIENKHGLTALRRAIQKKEPLIAEILLKSKANPNEVSSVDGGTALGSAVQVGSLSLVSLLLRYGANPNLNMRIGSPLSLSIAAQNYPIARLLLAYGASLSSLSEIERSDLQEALSRLLSESNPLIIPAIFNDIHTIRQLLSELPKETIAAYRTNQECALLGKCSPIRLKKVEELLRQQKSTLIPPLDINDADKLMMTPLHWAAAQGNNAIVLILLRHGANPLLTNEEGLRPAALAHQNGHSSTVELINNFIREIPRRAALSLIEAPIEGGTILLPEHIQEEILNLITHVPGDPGSSSSR